MSFITSALKDVKFRTSVAVSNFRNALSMDQAAVSGVSSSQPPYPSTPFSNSDRALVAALRRSSMIARTKA
jgi:hypothetical protein